LKLTIVAEVPEAATPWVISASPWKTQETLKVKMRNRKKGGMKSFIVCVGAEVERSRW